MSCTATDLFLDMHAAVLSYKLVRVTEDPVSPGGGTWVEAAPFSKFTLSDACENAVECRKFDRRWAIANALHFFSATEEADVLRQYNERADRFLTGAKWVGAYGAIAVPQIARCIGQLRQHPATRRAIVSMGELPEAPDINRPACWSFLHFMLGTAGLEMHVYQRSLSLFGVMPYDVVVLSNVQRFVAGAISAPCGTLHWTVGSLHCRVGDAVDGKAESCGGSLLLPYELMACPLACTAALCDPRGVKDSYIRSLLRGA